MFVRPFLFQAGWHQVKTEENINTTKWIPHGSPLQSQKVEVSLNAPLRSITYMLLRNPSESGSFKTAICISAGCILCNCVWKVGKQNRPAGNVIFLISPQFCMGYGMLSMKLGFPARKVQKNPAPTGSQTSPSIILSPSQAFSIFTWIQVDLSSLRPRLHEGSCKSRQSTWSMVCGLDFRCAQASPWCRWNASTLPWHTPWCCARGGTWDKWAQQNACWVVSSTKSK